MIEGIDSAGKSTQVEMLTKYYQDQGKKVQFFHFPNKSGLFGKEIYKHYNREKTYPKECLELLHTLDKMTMQEQITAWQQEYDVVILDRYTLSQYAYAVSSGLNERWVKNLMQYSLEEPDFGFILDLPAETASQRRAESDTYEANLDFQNKVRWAFVIRGQELGYHIVDATQEPEAIHNQIIKILKGEEHVLFR